MKKAEQAWQDICYAVRGIRNNPGFALAAVFLLALSIGANGAMFTVVRAVLLKPLAYREADQLMRISGGATPTRFEEMKASQRSFSGIAAFTGDESLALTGGLEPEVVTGARVSANFLEILGVNPLVGRSFLAAEDVPGGPPVAMISAELWQRRFGGDPHIVGKTAVLAAIPCTIVGVLPFRFQFPSPGLDAWMPRPEEWPVMAAKSRQLSPFLSIFGRLKPGVSREAASAEMTVIHQRYTVAHPAMLDAKKKTAEVTAMKEELVGNVRTTLWMLFGAVSFVLLIACANVASLLLARASSRSREFAVRTALGASRMRLLTQLLTESVVLSSAGGVVGTLLVIWSLQAIPQITSLELPRTGEIHWDWIVFGYAAVLSLGTGFMFGLAPSLQTSRPNLMEVLRSGGSGSSTGVPSRLFGRINGRGLLVAGQVALSVVLLIGAALLLESMGHLRRVDMGFNPANLLTTRISLPISRYDTDAKKAEFFRQLAERVETTPGVRSATVAVTLPLTAFMGSPVQDATKPLLRLNERRITTIIITTRDYFRTLGIPLRRGRDFTTRDTADSTRVAIIDEATAKHYWPEYPAGQNPIGQHLLIGGISAKAAEVIGIVATSKQNLENTAWPETIYTAFAQNPQPAAMLAVRTMGDPLPVIRSVRAQVRALDRDQPTLDAKTMDALVDAELGQRLLILRLLGSFACVAVLLALIGIYGALSYSVTQRVQELGIRRALGASEGAILGSVIRHGLGLTLAGVAIGIGAATLLTRTMKSLLFQVSEVDPATFVGIALLFVLMALIATYIPGRRATRVDPMTALRI